MHEKLIELSELRDNQDEYEVWDENKKEWVTYKESCYSKIKTPGGFPFPEEAKHEVVSIAYKSSKSNVFRVWGLKPYDASKSKVLQEGQFIQYTKCSDEQELLLKFLAFWEEHTPDIITGWNIRLFDIPYIVNRVIRILGEDIAKKMSPWKLVQYRQLKVKNKDLDSYELVGVSQLDYLDLFQKFGYSYGTQESYALDHIAHVVLGERKLSYEEHGSLHELYKNDHQTFIDYNIKDTSLVERIDQETGLMELACIMAYKAGVNYNDTLGTTAIWDSFIYRYLNQKNIVIPPGQHKTKSDYPGGYVKDPQIGMHDWVVSFDLNSLYPNLIVQYNMSPEKLIDYPDIYTKSDVDSYLSKTSLPDEIYSNNIAVAANGAQFKKDSRGAIPEIIIGLYDERREVKDLMLETEKELEKIDRLLKDRGVAI